ncbi:MAG: hypothetical protein FD129_1831, partial [bacterium]
MAAATVALGLFLAREPDVLAQGESGQRPEQEVTLSLEFTGQTKLNLLLETFSAGPGTTASDAEKTRGVVQNDLTLTDLFNLVTVTAGLGLVPP